MDIKIDIKKLQERFEQMKIEDGISPKEKKDMNEQVKDKKIR